MGARARRLLHGLNVWPSRGFREVYLWFAIAGGAALVALVVDAPADPWWSPWTAATVFTVVGVFELTKLLVERRRQHLVTVGAAYAVHPMSVKDWLILSVAAVLCGSGVANVFWPGDWSSPIVGVVQLVFGLYIGAVAWRRLRGPGAPPGSEARSQRA